MADSTMRGFVALLEKCLKQAIKRAAEMQERVDKATADASRAREEADACTDADDSKARDLEGKRDILISVHDMILEHIEESKEYIANTWQAIHEYEATIPQAA